MRSFDEYPAVLQNFVSHNSRRNTEDHKNFIYTRKYRFQSIKYNNHFKGVLRDFVIISDNYFGLSLNLLKFSAHFLVSEKRKSTKDANKLNCESLIYVFKLRKQQARATEIFFYNFPIFRAPKNQCIIFVIINSYQIAFEIRLTKPQCLPGLKIVPKCIHF